MLDGRNSRAKPANGRPRVRPSRESWKRLPEKRDAYLQNSVSARPVAPQLLTVGLSPRRAVLGIARMLVSLRLRVPKLIPMVTGSLCQTLRVHRNRTFRVTTTLSTPSRPQ